VRVLQLSAPGNYAAGGWKFRPVSKVTGSAITVTTTDGKNIDVALTSLTTVTKDGKTITAKEIKQGDRLVIHAKKGRDKLEATSVQLGGAKSVDQMNTHDVKGMDMGIDKSQQPQ
jgi:hypothetical protein